MADGAQHRNDCWSYRPFDHQCQDSIRLEAEGVLLILGRCEAGA